MTALSKSLEPLALPDFRRFLVASVLLSLANQVQFTALTWQLFQLTKSAAAIGMLGLAEVLPMLTLALVAGHISDRADRRRICVGAAASYALGAVALLAGSRWLPAHGMVAVAYAVMAQVGTTRAFFAPARITLGRELVPDAMVSAAVALRTGTFQLAVIVGPGVGGLLIWAAHGASWPAFAAGLALFIAGLASMALVRHRSLPPPAHAARESMAASLAAGIGFVARERAILAAMLLDLFAVLFGGATSMLAPYAETVLHVGPMGFGWLRAGQSIGALAMWIAMSLLPPVPRAGQTMLWATAGFGLCWIGIAYCPYYALTLALLVVSGALDYISVVVRANLVQARTPSHMLGRVSAVSSICISSSNELGAAESGLAAKLLGLERSVLIGGCITMAVVAIAARWARELGRLGRLDRLGPEHDAPAADGAQTAGVSQAR
jgi:MFS family permease